ncbi:MAG: acetyl-CoA carboxylase biotin carboxyl carrier protein [Planctomycetota bacterium]
MTDSLELIAKRSGERLTLASPDVGRFTCAVPKGQALVPGQVAGVLLRLGSSSELCVPAGVRGVVASEAPSAMRMAVDCGEVLYELLPLVEGAGDLEDEADTASSSSSSDGALLSEQSGRFYRKPAPTDPDFVSPGDVIEAGAAVGLIEVMKTFTQVHYTPSGGLPARARVVAFLAEDGADVSRGTPLLQVEPA